MLKMFFQPPWTAALLLFLSLLLDTKASVPPAVVQSSSDLHRRRGTVKTTASLTKTTTTAAPKTKTSRRSNDSTDTATSSTSSETLIFTGDCTFVSEPCVAPNKQDLIEFFHQKETMTNFLSAGGKRPCQQLPMTSDIRSLWERACEKHQYGPISLPNDDDIVIATDTDAQFPGFTMITTVLNGCKRLQDDTNGMPVYEFCMIGDRKHIVGSPPVVWLVRKLTGMSKENNDSTSTTFQVSETRAKSRISLVDTTTTTSKDDNTRSSCCSCAFQMDIDFTTTVKFPKMLLKLLPASKAKVQERGTQSVTKAIQKDASGAVEAVRQRWLEQCESSKIKAELSST